MYLLIATASLCREELPVRAEELLVLPMTLCRELDVCGLLLKVRLKSAMALMDRDRLNLGHVRTTLSAQDW